MPLPTSSAVEINFSGSTWTAVTTSVKRWQITQGSDSGPQPGTLTLELDNFDGSFTPENPLSAYYPNMVEGKAIRVSITKGSTSTRFYGWISSIVPSYPSELVSSSVTVTAVDLLGVWQRTQMKPWPVQVSTSWGYYPLTEKSARGTFKNLSATTLPDLYVAQLATTGSADAASDDSFSTDTDPCIALTSGRALRFVAEPTLGTGLSDNYAVAGLFKLTGSGGTLISTGFETVTWNGTGTVTVTGSGGSQTVAGVSVDVWHVVVMRRFNGQLNVTVDSTTSSSVSPATGTPGNITIGGDCTISVRDLAFAFLPVGGTLGSSSLPTNANYLPALGVGRTLADIATDLGFTWTTSPTTVNATATTVGGLSKFDAVKVAADSQSGRMWGTYTSTTSTVTVENDVDQKPITVALTIDAAADLSDAPSIARGLQDKVDTVNVNTPIGTTTVTSGTAGNFGSTTVDVDTFLRDANDQYAKATALIATSDALTSRLQSATVDLVTAQNDLYASWFTVRIGSRIRLSNLPSAYFGRTYLDAHVEGWTETFDAKSYTVELFTSPADAPPEAIADNTGGYATVPFGDGVATGPTATSAATSIAITWTGTQTLSTSAGDYPMDLDWNGERVTITTAPAGSTSPQTVTVTRGVAPTVARAHTAGEPIDVWLGARVAL